MRDTGYILKFIIVVIAQILLSNYFNFSHYVTLTILPAAILLLPIQRNTLFAMILAFVTGFLVDYFADGMLGLTSLSLVPVAFARKGIIRFVCGSEVFSREENLSVQKNGVAHLFFTILIASVLYFLVYIWADGAGTRPFWFNCAKFFASLAASSIFSVMVCFILRPDSQ